MLEVVVIVHSIWINPMLKNRTIKIEYFRTISIENIEIVIFNTTSNINDNVVYFIILLLFLCI